jgi:hypothetical protein
MTEKDFTNSWRFQQILQEAAAYRTLRRIAERRALRRSEAEPLSAYSLLIDLAAEPQPAH